MICDPLLRLRGGGISRPLGSLTQQTDADAGRKNNESLPRNWVAITMTPLIHRMPSSSASQPTNSQIDFFFFSVCVIYFRIFEAVVCGKRSEESEETEEGSDLLCPTRTDKAQIP